MRVTDENKDSIDKLHLLSGASKKDVREFFEALVSLIIMDYISGESTNIPFLGDIQVKVLTDSAIIEKEDVIIDFDIESNLLRNLQQIQDSTECDIEKTCKNRIKDSLANYMS